MKSGDEFTIVNVYSPCAANRQHVMWESLVVRLTSLYDHNVCVCGS